MKRYFLIMSTLFMGGLSPMKRTRPFATRRKLFAVLAPLAFVGFFSTTSYATPIQRSFDLELGDVVEDPNRDGVILLGSGFFFRDNPIVADVGDTVVIDLFFADRQRIQVFDFGEPTLELVSIGLGTQSGEPLIISGRWLGAFTMLGVAGKLPVGIS